MGEDDDRGRGGKPHHIVGKPGELLGPEQAEAAGLEVHDIDEADEVDAVLVERVPAGTFGVLAVSIETGPALIVLLILPGDALRSGLTTT